MRGWIERKRSAVRHPRRVSRLPAAKPQVRPRRGCIGDEVATKITVLTQGELPGSAQAVVPRTRERRMMTRQKSDGRVVPEGRRKPISTRRVECDGGGKATTVEQQEGQLWLLLGTAERAPAQADASDGGAARGGPRAASHAAPKPRSKAEKTQPVTMEIGLRVKPKMAWQAVYSGRRSLWALSHSAAVDKALRNAHWAELGLESLAARWKQHPARLVVAPAKQLTLALG